MPRAGTGNPTYGVGGTGEDGGLSTADTVADGGVDDTGDDYDYGEDAEEPVGGSKRETRSQTASKAAKSGSGTKSSTKSSDNGGVASKEGSAKKSNNLETGPGNPNYGVGGTGEDGGMSTEATVEDGGADAVEEDPDFKP